MKHPMTVGIKLPAFHEEPRRYRREGAILLLVLSMLTLFLLMGAAGLTLANRARATSRAFANALSTRGMRPTLAASALEEALLKLLRGPAVPGKMSECLLADKYGESDPATGTVTAIQAEPNTPLLRATITGFTVNNELNLNGRIVTLKPRGTDAAGPLSFRILRVDSGSVFWLINLRPYIASRMPAMPCDAIMNGKEFQTEAWDAFGASNPFLARVTADAVGNVQTVTPSFATASLPTVVDNDNDGVADGVWLTGTDNFFPSMPAIGGGEIKFSVSYLVLDLDGRLNVNAHGRPSGATDPANGLASINGGSVLPQGDACWRLLLAGGQPLGTGTTPSTSNWRPSPFVGSQVDGRYGILAPPLPGNFSPYDLRLDVDAPRVSSQRRNAGQNPFAIGELERVLRQFDADAGTLPTRLAALLDSSSQVARLLVTTDSWDTPGLTGTAAQNIAASGTAQTLAPDVATGLRFDLNRSWTGNSANDRREYFEDLYEVIVSAITPPSATRPSDPRIAQWVANVVAFRDKDSSQAHQYSVPTGATVRGMEPPNNPATLGSWNDGKFMSHADLLAIPTTTEQEFQDHVNAGTHVSLRSLADEYPQILDAVFVPSPFASCRLSVPPQSLQAVGMQTLLDNQVSRWREPGRVNVNTCPSTVWQLFPGVTPTPAFAAQPAQNNLEILRRAFSDRTCVNIANTNNRDLAGRLSNSSTVRSSVFAVWITVKIEDTSHSADPPSFHRLFAIVDRSIPAGYRPGEDLNVRDTVRLLRYLE